MGGTCRYDDALANLPEKRTDCQNGGKGADRAISHAPNKWRIPGRLDDAMASAAGLSGKNPGLLEIRFTATDEPESATCHQAYGRTVDERQQKLVSNGAVSNLE